MYCLYRVSQSPSSQPSPQKTFELCRVVKRTLAHVVGDNLLVIVRGSSTPRTTNRIGNVVSAENKIHPFRVTPYFLVKKTIGYSTFEYPPKNGSLNQEWS